MSACDSPEIDIEGTNVTASRVLDNHHDAIGVSEYGDDVLDTCGICLLAVGWIVEPEGHDSFGHATALSVEEAIAACGRVDAKADHSGSSEAGS